MTFTLAQLIHVATEANKMGGKGYRLLQVIPPENVATAGKFDFQFVYDRPDQTASEKDWRD